MTAQEVVSAFDRKTRRQLAMYATVGYVGFLIGEALAYIALLEEELAARDKSREANG